MVTSGPILWRPRPKASSRDQQGMKSSRTPRISQCRQRCSKQVKKKETSWWAHSQLFSLLTGSPAIQQVRVEGIISKNELKKRRASWTFTTMRAILYVHLQPGWPGICQIRKSWKWSWTSWRKKSTLQEQQSVDQLLEAECLSIKVGIPYLRCAWVDFASAFFLNNRWLQTVQIPVLSLRSGYPMILWLKVFQMTRTRTKETRGAV